MINVINIIFFRTQNVTDQIFAAIKEMVPEGGARTLKVADVTERCTAKGFKIECYRRVH